MPNRVERIGVLERVLSVDDRETISCDITLDELNKVIGELNVGKGSGPDDISTEMLKHITANMKNRLLDLFNPIWNCGQVPKRWKEGNVVLLLKRGLSIISAS